MINRRRFITLASGLTALMPAFVRPSIARANTIPDASLLPTHRAFARVMTAGAAVRASASEDARLVRRLALNDVVDLLGKVEAKGPAAHNPFWYKVSDGFVYSALVQPADYALNPALPEVVSGGLWGDITVPTTEGRSQASASAPLRVRYYFGGVIRINELLVDNLGLSWYRVSEGDGGPVSFVRAAHIRPLTGEDFAPLSPDVDPATKRIDVDLRAQRVTAYEADNPVFTARVSTGGQVRLRNGEISNRRTTPGQHRVFMKIAGQRMNGGNAGDNDFWDLPGVSWVTYFTGTGIAFHSTYWHNDFGRPRSRGCVNMLPEDAKWIFRWTTPGHASDQIWTRVAGRNGTRVNVF
jgi:L,D-transpeptidase catalytic domain